MNFLLKLHHIIHGESVITTATDLNNKFGVDTLARKYYLKINNVIKYKNNKFCFVT